MKFPIISYFRKRKVFFLCSYATNTDFNEKIPMVTKGVGIHPPQQAHNTFCKGPQLVSCRPIHCDTVYLKRVSDLTSQGSTPTPTPLAAV